jgi:hypothetical protein
VRLSDVDLGKTVEGVRVHPSALKLGRGRLIPCRTLSRLLVLIPNKAICCTPRP